MIGKQIKGKGFKGLLKYLQTERQARLIGGNMGGQTPPVLAAEFRVACDLNPRLQNPVYYATLSLPKTDTLTDDRWSDLADDYMTGMGFEGCQYAVFRPINCDYDQIHIIACRIRITNGSTVSDAWDYPRSEKVIRELEQKYQLTPLPPTQKRERRPPTAKEQKRQQRTGEGGVREQLLTCIEQAATDQPSLAEFIRRLQTQDVEIRLRQNQAGQINGISYELNGIAFSGSKLGRAYTFNGLQKYRGISVQQPR